MLLDQADLLRLMEPRSAAGRGLQAALTWKPRLTHNPISLAGIRTLKRRKPRAVLFLVRVDIQH